MEWLFPWYWVATADPTAWWRGGDPRPAPEACARPDDLDLDLVRIVYAVLAEGVECGICRAPLDAATSVARSRGLFTATRIVVATRCRGPGLHRHRATITERAGDLRLGQLRPA